MLTLRCLALALLAVVFARPFFEPEAANETRAVVVVLDNSLSLQAGERWDTLQSWLRRPLGRFAPGDRVGVMLASPEPSWLVPPTTDTSRAVAALAEVRPGWRSARLEPALRLAGTALVGMPADRREIILLTDHQRVAWQGAEFSRSLPAGLRLIAPEVAAPVTPQAAILPPTLTAAGDTLRAAVRIRNFGPRQTRTLRVFRDDQERPLHEGVVSLEPNDERAWSVALPHAADTPARFRFNLDADDFPADDESYGVWRPHDGGLVLLAAAPPPVAGQPAPDFLAVALKAAGSLPPPLVLRPLPESDWPADAIVLLRGESPFTAAGTQRLDAFLARGGAAVLFATGEPAQREWLARHDVQVQPLPEAPEPWRLRGWLLEHPLVEAVARYRVGVLLDWEFRRGCSLSSARAEPLAHWSAEQPAISELQVGPGRLLLCGVAPDRSSGDWPATPGFVQFVHQACLYLLQQQRAAPHFAEVGVPLALPRAGRWDLRSGPRGVQAAREVPDVVVPEFPGLYEFSSGETSGWYAVNLPGAESDLAGWDAGTPWTKLQAAATDVAKRGNAPPSPEPMSHVRAEEAERRQPLWWWAAVAAFVLLLLELALANRTAR